MFVGQAVSVDIYPDRIEIKTLAGFGAERRWTILQTGNRAAENPKLMSLMGATPLEHAEGPLRKARDRHPGYDSRDGVSFAWQARNLSLRPIRLRCCFPGTGRSLLKTARGFRAMWAPS